MRDRATQGHRCAGAPPVLDRGPAPREVRRARRPPLAADRSPAPAAADPARSSARLAPGDPPALAGCADDVARPGSRTSSKNTSLKSVVPVISRSGRTSTPALCMSRMNAVMPPAPPTGSVRGRAGSRSRPTGPTCSRPSGRRRRTSPSSRAPASATTSRSLPASGSLKSWVQMWSPAPSVAGTWRCLLVGAEVLQRTGHQRVAQHVGDAGRAELLFEDPLLERDHPARCRSGRGGSRRRRSHARRRAALDVGGVVGHAHPVRCFHSAPAGARR